MTGSGPKPNSMPDSWCSCCISESSYLDSSGSGDRIFTSGIARKTIVDDLEETLDEPLNPELIDYHHSDIELLDFVHHILGLDKSKGEQVLAMSPALDVALLREYSKVMQAEDPSGPFKAMADNLLSSLLNNLGEGPDHHIATSAQTLEVIDWTVVESQTRYSSLAIAKHLLAFFPTVDGSEAHSQSTPAMPFVELPRSAQADGPGSNRKGSLDAVKPVPVEDSEGRAHKKAHSDNQHPLINSNLPFWASAALAATGRYWVTGLVVDRYQVTLCYFDRFLVASASSFSLLRSPGCLALVLFAMRQTTRTQAGFDPHLRPWPSSIGRVTVAPGSQVQPKVPVKNVVGSYFEYPMNLSGSAPTSFLVTDIIQRPDGLLSRATAVYKGRLLHSDGTLFPATYVLKLSWPLKRSVSEIDTVKLLKAKLPVETHDHLPDFRCATTLDAPELSLPWLGLNLDLTDKNHCDRVLRGMVGKIYSNLCEAGSIESFKRVWLDCLELHYLAFKLGKVLHRDLSEGNLMVLQLPDGSVKGVLNDWDMAKHLGQLTLDGEQCVGTPPFMAMDLLEGRSCTHLLRHELESFVYILIWAAVHYDLANKRRDSDVHPLLQLWMGSMQEIHGAKSSAFFPGGPFMTNIYGAAKPEFKDLVKEWIEPLRDMFITARFSYYLLPEESQSDALWETYGGQITFKKFMAAINVTPRTWDIPNFLNDDD